VKKVLATSYLLVYYININDNKRIHYEKSDNWFYCVLGWFQPIIQ